jgi:hypothetical protein
MQAHIPAFFNQNDVRLFLTFQQNEPELNLIPFSSCPFPYEIQWQPLLVAYHMNQHEINYFGSKLSESQ